MLQRVITFEKKLTCDQASLIKCKGRLIAGWQKMHLLHCKAMATMRQTEALATIILD